jgi:hypothetical protein
MTGVLGKTVEELGAYIGVIHGRLTDIVDDNLGSRPTASIETLLIALEKELPKLRAKADRYDRQTDPEEESEMDRNARLIMTMRGSRRMPVAKSWGGALAASRSTRPRTSSTGKRCRTTTQRHPARTPTGSTWSTTESSTVRSRPSQVNHSIDLAEQLGCKERVEEWIAG